MSDPRLDHNTEGPLNQRTPLPNDFPRVAQTALREAGYQYLEEFTSATAKELLKIHGVGPKGVRILREVLHAHGLALAGE